MKRYLLYLLLFGTVSACKKDSPGPDPAETETSMEMTMGGQDISINENKIQAFYYADSGEPDGALEVSAQLPDGERMVFFLDETTSKTTQLNQQFPAVIGLSADGFSGLAVVDKSGKTRTLNKVAATKAANTAQTQTTVTVPVYVKYVTKTNQLFAISGNITVKIDGDDLTFEWDITFKDADGKTFTAKGSSTIKDYKANLKPRSQINNPGANLTITEVMPDYGSASTEVTLKGTGFSALPDENKVKLGDRVLTVTSASSTELNVTIPEDGVHGHLSVSVLGATAESTAVFHYAPIVEGADKTSAKAGDEVTLTGKHFDTDPRLLEVKVGDKVMEIISATLTEVKFKIVAGTESGKITIARKGKGPVEGPELEIATTTPTTGIPIEELFEVTEGNLTIEEILPNNNEHGAMLAMQIDEKNHILYAYNTQNLVAINLNDKSVTHILDASHPIMKMDFPLTPAHAFILQAIFPAGDGYLYGAKHAAPAMFSTQNVFKLNVNTKEYSFLGTGKASNASGVNDIFVGSDKRFYIPEFIKYNGTNSTYGMAVYDENLANMNPLTDKIYARTYELAKVVPTGDNRFRLVGYRGYPGDIQVYRDVDNGTIGAEVEWKAQFDALQNNGDGWMLGIDHAGGNFYALYGDNNDVNVNEYPKFTYSIGATHGNDGPFERKGRFNIIKTFEEGGKTKYMRAYHSLFNVFAADKNGSIYMLVQQDGVPGAGGIYKISF